MNVPFVKRMTQHTSGGTSAALQRFSATMLRPLSVWDFFQRAHRSLCYDRLWAENIIRNTVINKTNIIERQENALLLLTSVSVQYSVCSEPVLPVLCLLFTFIVNSQGSISNISCCVSFMKFISFSLFAVSLVLPDPGCFLRATVRWWVFLLHDTTRLTRPGLLPERLTGNLGRGELLKWSVEKHITTCTGFNRKYE